MELHQAVAGNIHRIRKSQRLSMDRAAELAGISVSMWGQVERGSVNPTLAVLGKIAAGLHVPLELLIENREALFSISPKVLSNVSITSASYS